MSEGPTASLWVALRNHPLLSREVPLEAAISYPVPYERDGVLMLRFFLYRVDGQSTPYQVHAPFARLTATQSGRLIEYVHRDWEPPCPGLRSTGPLGEAESPALAGLTPKDLVRRDEVFLNRYDVVLAIFPRSPVDDLERVAIREFAEDAKCMLEPALLPYYRALGAGFFDWLARHAEDLASA